MPIAQVRDLRLYYELHGAGEPLVLLNGALDTIESDWGRLLPTLAADYRVLAYEHRGHGRSDNPPARFEGYDQLVADLVALLDLVGVERAHFCGFSDGAMTLINFVLRYPERVRSLILAGAQYTNDERTLATLEKMTPERIAERQPAWAARLAVLHDTHHAPGYWKELLRQMLPFWHREPDYSLEQLAQIGVPTLLIAGERDPFGHLDQQVAMRRAIPRAELCIAPIAAHFVMNDQPELFQLVALNFLKRTGEQVR
ncbi:MAG TPA: alpha/beta hydrolase [Roseiflexaceae bacterium]|nr:alpha/beta hydrolase [Roseiflexaceae bacterium]